MRIVKHIESLLLKENSVIVPELGCFMAHNISARFDDKENVFLPPMRTLGFNPRVTINDSLLVQSYIETHSMSYPDALKEIESEVKEIKAALNERGIFDFEGVGVLRYKNSQYDFIPCSSGLLTPVMYGFDALDIPTIKQILAQKRSDDTTVNAVLKPSFQPSEEKKKSIFSKPNDEPIVITIQRATLRKCATAAAILALIALSVIPMRYAASSMEKLQMASVANAVTETKEQTKANVYKVQPKKVVAKKPAKATLLPAPQAENAKFTIVLAAGITKEGAAAYTDSLRNEGINASIAEGKSPQVVYGTYASASDARNEINKHANHPRFSVAWIKGLK
ncbi:MAG: hypothetical protein HUK06_00610 [Bacteroidaceae bacterium]|nr:hypothetical protein [Bacteroidaceae bacterium]